MALLESDSSAREEATSPHAERYNIRARRDASGVHVETKDSVTWLPYGVSETRMFTERIAPLLSR
ncbi:hypothetical protein L227DRAFT_578745 [Lentinus tigrinus ALCF2SS1-6]|uniref:Uncharacterized protein n=1 Tax=Lentinus tigrinus ALCF2SS1-6 TaxID=1328759 RepID=A0A5C2RZS9_9APHY|nr:hypothetical protein L227DRAFT_578745 [Lentinus tigrinus ALCF2SS1-6]